MSSSRQSSPTERRQRTGVCPTCGSRRVVAVEEDVVLRIGRRMRRFERIPHEHCLACGERIFGIDASRQFDLVLLKRRGRSAA